MRAAITRPVRRVLHRLGFDVVRRPAAGDAAVESFPVDYDPETIALFQLVKPYTLTGHERVFALRQAVRYVVEAGIEGAIVECGVWRGGSMMAVAKTLVDMGATDRDLYLFDTFTHMPFPGERDVDVLGRRAVDYYDEAVADPYYAYLPLDEVRRVLLSTGYPADRLHFVQGMVEDTVPEHAPADIALLRLDTDLYVSTVHEMKHLFPRITEDGVLLVDDYGHFVGAKDAVDEYFAALGAPVLLNRIDYTARLVVVTARLKARLAANA